MQHRDKLKSVFARKVETIFQASRSRLDALMLQCIDNEGNFIDANDSKGRVIGADFKIVADRVEMIDDQIGRCLSPDDLREIMEGNFWEIVTGELGGEIKSSDYRKDVVAELDILHSHLSELLRNQKNPQIGRG